MNNYPAAIPLYVMYDYNSWFDYLSGSKYLVLVDLKLANTSPATITLTVCLLMGHLATLNLYMVTATSHVLQYIDNSQQEIMTISD